MHQPRQSGDPSTPSSRPVLLAIGFAALLLFSSLGVRLAVRGGPVEEVDSILFLWAVHNGIDVTAQRPHPPGYPAYVLLGQGAARLAGSPERGLESLSLVAGVLAPLIFWRLLAQWTSEGRARALAFLMVVNPMAALYSTSALSDELSLLVALVLALCTATAHRSRVATIALLPVLSLAVGVRPQCLVLAPLVALGFWRSWRSERHGAAATWRAGAWGTVIAALVTGLWLVPLVAGSGGVAPLRAAMRAQRACCVDPHSAFAGGHVDLTAVTLRTARYLAGYFREAALAPQSGGVAAVAVALGTLGWCAWLLVPQPPRRRLELACWLLPALVPILGVHLLYRYAMAFLPAALAAVAFGLTDALSVVATPALPRRERAVFALGLVAVTASALVFFHLQPPIVPYEGRLDYRVLPLRQLAAFLILGLVAGLLTRLAIRRFPEALAAVTAGPPRRLFAAVAAVLLTLSAAELWVSARARGHHQAPPVRAVQQARARFAEAAPLLCSGPTTWPFVPQYFVEADWQGWRGRAPVAQLLRAAAQGRLVLLMGCDLEDRVRWRGGTLVREIEVTGDSFLWAKSPSATIWRLDGQPVVRPAQ